MKHLQVIVIIEVQLVLILLFFCVFRLSDIAEKVKRTNMFLHEDLKNARFEDIQKVRDLDIVIGNENAPVTIFMYTKLSCEYCSDFFETTYPELRSTFIETGHARFIIRFLPNGKDREAIDPIHYFYCMNDLDLFEEFNKKRITERQNNLDIDYINEFIVANGADTTGLAVCLSSENLDKFIGQMAEQAQQADIHGSPFFIINGQALRGSRKFSKFKAMIESIE
ncbi:MAG: thioredoxin domain-containing protein [Saprospiraceae bacterium]|uniref:Thioredoxin domain-containing protein n=1 Tax=Candidatus Opimibacter skivensis TaxID=2982028 RepID=A0A9D7SSR6_9BACT|nr:thioredoxin domain-containing protein [Candidatus Opimibacter skivensis]